MKNITYTSIKNKKVTLLLLALCILFGAFNYINLPRQESPDVSSPAALVKVIYPGASPADMEELVTKKIEDTVSEIDGFDRVKSTSKNSFSNIVVYLKDGVDSQASWDDLIKKIDAVKAELPSGAKVSVNTELTTTVGIVLSLSSNDYTSEELADYADIFKKELTKINGVTKFEIDGELKKEIIVEVDFQSLNYHNISLDDFSSIIKSQNLSIPSGELDDGIIKIPVNSNGSFNSLDDIKNTIIGVSSAKGNILRVKDIAEVRYDVQTSSARYKHRGENTVLLSGYFEDSLNVVKVGKEVRKEIEDLKMLLPQDINFEEIIFQPEDVEKSINNFIINLLEAIVLVILVVLFGMGPKNAIIVSTCIPLSMALTFISMSFFEIKLEQMSISALIIALGMLVDNAIVVSDSIQHRIDKGEDKFDACVNGSKEVSVSMLTSTLTTVFAFAPLLMINSAVGQYIFGVPSVVIIALLSSYLCAIISTPLFAFMFFAPSKSQKKLKPERIKKLFEMSLDFSMKNKKATFAILAIMLMVTMFTAKSLDVSMFPKADKDIVYINLKSENPSDIDATEKLVDNMASIVQSQPEVTSYSQSAGDGFPKFFMTVKKGSPSKDTGQILVKFDLSLSERFETRGEFLSHLQEEIDKSIVGGTAVAYLLDAGTGGSSPIEVRVSASSMEDLEELVTLTMIEMENTSGTKNISSNFIPKEYQFNVDVDSNKASSFGINKYDIQNEVSIALKGKSSSTLRKNSKEYNIILKSNISTKEELENLSIKSSVTGQKVVLKEVASVNPKSLYPVISRYDREKSVLITSDVQNGYSASEVQKEIKKRIRSSNEFNRDGSSISFDGEASAIADSFSELGFLAIAALILIFGVLVYQFDSYVQPFVILLTIPLALIGAIFGLFALNLSISFTAMLGIVSLMGIVVNNAIVLIDYINLVRSNGRGLEEACRLAIERRFDPIILSTTTTIIGLVPLLLFGGEMFRPMAASLIGGLFVSTFLTLVVVPTIYETLEKRFLKKTKKAS